MERIDNWDEYFMRMAYLAAQKSHDPKTKIGSILVKNNIPVMTGYNSFPRGVLDSKERYENRELKRKLVAHSEANTVYLSARVGVSTEGCTLYTLGQPCHGCAIPIIQGGIKEIVVHEQWPNMSMHPSWLESFELSTIMFAEANIPIRVFNKKLGLIGFMDGKEVSV